MFPSYGNTCIIVLYLNRPKKNKQTNKQKQKTKNKGHNINIIFM
jgi:hypothetical protein